MTQSNIDIYQVVRSSGNRANLGALPTLIRIIFLDSTLQAQIGILKLCIFDS